jgi:translation initiation factor 2 subunit 2
LLKKKKKKKTGFDLDAALAEGESTEAPAAAPDTEANEAGDDLDLENFGKKKRKKKKTGFNLDDLDAALPSTSAGDEAQEERKTAPSMTPSTLA